MQQESMDSPRSQNPENTSVFFKDLYWEVEGLSVERLTSELLDFG